MKKLPGPRLMLQAYANKPAMEGFGQRAEANSRAATPLWIERGQ
jgi:hypothetical protein